MNDNDVLSEILNLSEKSDLEETNPIEIFRLLSKKDGYEYLRSEQTQFLNKWEKIRDNKCVVGRLKTGSGKTLVSLLMLLAKMHEDKKPSLYLCPTKQLVRQTVKEASNYNIPARELPNRSSSDFTSVMTDFRNSEVILVVTFERLFNGKSIFGVRGLNNDIEEVGTILIDDAHSCLERAKEKYTISINNNGEEKLYYQRMKEIFESSLREQSISEYESLDRQGSAVMQIPYSCVDRNIEKIKTILKEMLNDEKLNDSQIIFSYDLVIDYINTCDIYISNDCISIVPMKLALEQIPSYVNANKIAMSATFNNYSDLIENLGFSKKSVENAVIVNTGEEGGKYFVFPTFYKKDTDCMRKLIGKTSMKENIVVLVPDYKRAKHWEEEGFEVVDNDTDEYEKVFRELKEGSNKKVVFVNRYDGLDLKQKMCSFLVIDGLPQVHSLEDKYLNKVLPDSFITKKETAQILEQGFGRSVRSPSDKSIIVLLGDKLQTFVLTNSNLKFFSSGLRKQIEFAKNIEKGNKQNIHDVLNTFIRRFIRSEDNEFLQIYRKYIGDKESENSFEDEIIELASKNLILANSFVDADKDVNNTQEIVNEIEDMSILKDTEKGWYFQILAKAYYKNRYFDTALKIQKKAFSLNNNLLKPWKEERKVSVQAKNIIKNINNRGRKIIRKEYLSFGEDSDSTRFEEELNNLGKVLGFECSMPEREYKKKKGAPPDNLWVDREKRIVYSIECKNEKKIKNTEISKTELGQTSNSSVWTRKKYKGFDVYAVIVNRKNERHKKSNNDNNTYVMTEEGLNHLLRNVEKLLDNNYQNENQIQYLLDDNKLNSNQIINSYMNKLN